MPSRPASSRTSMHLHNNTSYAHPSAAARRAPAAAAAHAGHDLYHESADFSHAAGLQQQQQNNSSSSSMQPFAYSRSALLSLWDDKASAPLPPDMAASLSALSTDHPHLNNNNNNNNNHNNNDDDDDEEEDDDEDEEEEEDDDDDEGEHLQAAAQPSSPPVVPSKDVDVDDEMGDEDLAEVDDREDPISPTRSISRPVSRRDVPAPRSRTASSTLGNGGPVATPISEAQPDGSQAPNRGPAPTPPLSSSSGQARNGVSPPTSAPAGQRNNTSAPANGLGIGFSVSKNASGRGPMGGGATDESEEEGRIDLAK